MNNLLTKILNKQREEFDKEFNEELNQHSHCSDDCSKKWYESEQRKENIRQNTLNTTELLEEVKKMLEDSQESADKHPMLNNGRKMELFNKGYNSALATAISNIEETLNINK